MTYGLSQSRLHSLVRQRALTSTFVAPISRPGTGFSASSVSCLRGLCVSALPLNLQLPTLNSESLAAIIAQPAYFHNLPHSFKTSQKTPLCFHNLTNSFSRNQFLLKTLQNDRGCTPSLRERKAANPTNSNLVSSSRPSSMLTRETGKRMVMPYSHQEGNTCAEQR
jgi:hypothetical protein